MKLQLVGQETVREGVMPYEEFYQRYWQQSVYYLQKKGMRSAEAEDLASQAFLYCYQHYDRYDPSKASLQSWLYMVLNSRWKNYLRDRKQHVDIDDYTNLIQDERSAMEQAMMLSSVRSQLARALRALPDGQRKVVILSKFQQKSAAEIALMTGMTPGNVRTTLSRGMARLEAEFLRIRQEEDEL